MNYLKNEIYIKNIFRISDNIFNISTFNERKVKINNTCDVILIPDRNELIDNGSKYDIWYSIDELKLMRANYVCELNIISRVNGVNMRDAQLIWKQIN